MTREQIEKIIEGIKLNTELYSLFGENINYDSFHSDLDNLGLIIKPLNTNYNKILDRELVQFQIIDKKTPSTSLQMKGYMDSVKNYLNSNIRNFNGFETVRIHDNGDEILLKNNKDRFVFTKRFLFFY